LLQFGEARTQLGSGLLHYGLAPHMTVGIYSVNCTGWVLVAEAANAYSMVPVPLYDTLGPDAVRYISGHAELSAIACSANLLSVLLPCLAECPTIQLVVSVPYFARQCAGNPEESPAPPTCCRCCCRAWRSAPPSSLW